MIFMSWVYLIIASIFEVGWPLGLKIATNSQYRIFWIIFAAIWTGIGASCTFLIGVYIFHDALNLMRALGVIFIITGVILLKLET